MLSSLKYIDFLHLKAYVTKLSIWLSKLLLNCLALSKLSLVINSKIDWSFKIYFSISDYCHIFALIFS